MPAFLDGQGETNSASQLEATLAAFDFDLTDEQYTEVTGFFDTGVKEEAGGEFPGLRRELAWIASASRGHVTKSCDHIRSDPFFWPPSWYPTERDPVSAPGKIIRSQVNTAARAPLR